jgi:hypothetical protein
MAATKATMLWYLASVTGLALSPTFAASDLMRVVIAFLVTASVVYLMTGLVYAEGDFAGALVIKPYPMLPLTFGGGEEGAWARYHPGKPRPWFMRHDFVEICRFDWEYGVPALVPAYTWGYLLTILAWPVLGVVGVFKLLIRRRKLASLRDVPRS